MCVYGPENNVFARSGACNNECPEKTETLPFGRAPSIKAELAALVASVSSRAKKSTAHAPTASHWTLPTLPLDGAGVGYAIFDILARILDFAIIGVKS